MFGNLIGLSDERIERSCGDASPDWIRQTEAIPGVELLEAWFRGPAYQKHRHDNYSIGLTVCGVQAFGYRGSTHFSTPGEVVVLHPDEIHDGYAGAATGFGYRQLYVDPALIFEAVRALGRRPSLPFVRQPVVTSGKLSTAIRSAFRNEREPLAIDDLVMRLAEGLMEAGGHDDHVVISRHLDVAAIERGRKLLDAERSRVVRSWELESTTGLTRYEFARQFRAMVGISPYRYSLMRRLELAQALIARRRPLVEVALETGFSDQAHFTRMFTAAFGITPRRFWELTRSGQM